MALYTNALTSYSAKGNREDLTDEIFNISPTETPYMNNARRGKATAVLHEWQTDALAAASTSNQQLEGDVVTPTASTPTARVGNYCEIARKDWAVTDTQEAVDKAGRKSEVALQKAKRAAEIKRDMESSLLANKAANGGNGTTARVTAGLGAMVSTNVDKDASGGNPTWTSGTPSAGRTDGTQRAFTETIHKNVLQLGWTNGADFKFVMVGPKNKQVMSTFSGIATKTWNFSGDKSATIVGAADVYVGDFGVVRIVPNRLQRDRDAWYLDNEYISIDFLRPITNRDLPKTGDATAGYLICEYAHKVGTEKALGLAADLATT